MRYRSLLLAAVFASGLAGAETIAVDNGIAVKESDVATPTRGMTMDQVANQIRRAGDQGSRRRQTADFALGISGLHRVFRSRPRDSQRGRELLIAKSRKIARS